MKRIVLTLLTLTTFVACSVSPFSGGDTSARDGKATIAPAKNREALNFPFASSPLNLHSEGSNRIIDSDAFVPFVVHNGAINAFAASADGKTLYTGGDDGRVVQIVLTGSGAARNVKVSTILEGTKPILALALSADESLLAVSQTSLVVAYDTKKGEVAHALTRIKGRATSLAWDPRSEYLLIGLAGGQIHAWSFEEGLFMSPGRDSLDALELYSGGVSPVTSLVFHPGAGVFFSAEKEGVLSLWRLLRTEQEIGLRDEFAISDRRTDITERSTFAALGSTVEDFWLNKSASIAYAATGDGKIQSWKVRGLVKLPELSVTKDELFSITGVPQAPETTRISSLDGEVGTDVLVAAGREPRVRFVCYKKNLPGLDKLLIDSTEELKGSVVVTTSPFKKPINRVRAGKTGNILWAAAKTDTIYLFEINEELRDELKC